MTRSETTRTVVLFVYGTLMRGGKRHRVLAGQRFLGEARTRPHYVLVDLGAYPGLVHAQSGGQTIYGELYEIESDLISRLDRIEGAPRLFRLESVQIEGYPGEVFAYFYQQSTQGLLLCSEGRWRNQRFTS